MHPILIPLAEIDAAALPRDRTGLDPEPLDELRLSIATSGLRMPIEVWELSEPRGPHRYGLISGFRRLQAFRDLFRTAADKTPYTAIPAFVREPASYAAALAAMVEENAVRADLSPFERGLIAVTARNAGIYASIEEAVNALYSSTNGFKRSRLRTLAFFAEEMEGQITAPEKLSQAQCLRIAKALTAGFGEVIRIALDESSQKDHDTQWELLKPILAEADDCARAGKAHRPGRRPRRVVRPRYGLTIRRERTRDGWCLHITGREATSGMIDTVLENIELMYSPG